MWFVFRRCFHVLRLFDLNFQLSRSHIFFGETKRWKRTKPTISAHTKKHSFCVSKFKLSVLIVTTLITVGISVWLKNMSAAFRYTINIYHFMCILPSVFFTWTNCCARLNLIIPKSLVVPTFFECVYVLCECVLVCVYARARENDEVKRRKGNTHSQKHRLQSVENKRGT